MYLAVMSDGAGKTKVVIDLRCHMRKLKEANKACRLCWQAARHTEAAANASAPP